MEFKKQLSEYQNKIESLLMTYTPSEKSGYHDLVNDAMAYSLMAGGKRIRPVIVMAVHNMFKPYNASIEPFAVAIEMVHTYSLIHDDLPAMDDDDLRRGKPTCHIKYGEDIAILAGDGLLNRAFEVMLEGILKYDLGSAGIKAAACLGEKSGTRGMIGGQVADITYENKEVDMDVIGYIHQHKTSALIEAAFMMGGYLAKCPENSVKNLQRIGRCIGLAFQIQDDLLDITSTEEVLGKPINSDQKNHKITYVDLKGIDGSRAVVEDLLNEADVLLDKFEGDVTFLKGFVAYLKNRKY